MAARELLKRREAREDLLAFTRYTMPRYKAGEVHHKIGRALHDILEGVNDRLMIFMPPRHGKTELVTRRFSAFYLGHRPQHEVISASYGSELALDFGRDVRNIVAQQEYNVLFPKVRLAEDSKAKGRWHTNAGGGYVAAGEQTSITGRGAHLFNIDDPIKNREEADSQTIRDRIWNWYTSTAYTRLADKAAIILTMTRWHEDDLAGRLLEEAKAGGDQWIVLNFSAVDEKTGAYTPVWPEGGFDTARYERICAVLGGRDSRDWTSLYEQKPRAQEGTLFKTAMIGIVDAAPVGGQVVRAWDLAATAQTNGRDPDWTVGVKLMKTPEGKFIVLDVVRLRGGPDEVEKAIVNTAAQDGVFVKIGLPQDPGQAGKQQVLYLTRKLTGFRVESSPETGDKATRAGPSISQANVGNFALIKAAWNKIFLEELGVFPAGAKDDQVDALSRAFMMLTPRSTAELHAALGRMA